MHRFVRRKELVYVLCRLVLVGWLPRALTVPIWTAGAITDTVECRHIVEFCNGGILSQSERP